MKINVAPAPVTPSSKSYSHILNLVAKKRKHDEAGHHFRSAIYHGRIVRANKAHTRRFGPLVRHT